MRVSLAQLTRLAPNVFLRLVIAQMLAVLAVLLPPLCLGFLVLEGHVLVPVILVTNVSTAGSVRLFRPRHSLHLAGLVGLVLIATEDGSVSPSQL
ncbi:hypothetical protein F4813DRAFT_359075 [Daldinia decipiens]|uniref:uncharacterized protein n=1 Tax=Daldinia decipiens TaxID=326647 RepID=UPI0020C204A9|nr:uncharacterized protein F4813DRAFT_359075 [Daldinia decipiens]KAI1657608.1 hypothetical protein F4813DRAFT_359075 [Daldinia decipiens]